MTKFVLETNTAEAMRSMLTSRKLMDRGRRRQDFRTWITANTVKVGKRIWGYEDMRMKWLSWAVCMCVIDILSWFVVEALHGKMHWIQYYFLFTMLWEYNCISITIMYYKSENANWQPSICLGLHIRSFPISLASTNGNYIKIRTHNHEMKLSNLFTYV